MRHARLELSPGTLRLLAVDARRNVLRATCDDALRVAVALLPAGTTVQTSTPEMTRLWVRGKAVWRYSVTIQGPELLYLDLSAELERRGFSVRVETARRGIIGA